MMLSNTELERMRETADQAMPDVAVVQRVAFASDGMGGLTQTWSTAATTVCRVDPPGRNPLVSTLGERIANRQVFVVSLPEGTDVLDGDRIIVGSATYEVLGTLGESWEIVIRAVCVL